MIDFLRKIRAIMDFFSRMEIYGFPVDIVFHFLGAFFLVWILQLKFSLKKSARMVVGILIVKELLDIFAKSRIEYIRPPALDLVMDLFFGFSGILVSYYFIRKRQRARETPGNE